MDMIEDSSRTYLVIVDRDGTIVEDRKGRSFSQDTIKLLPKAALGLKTMYDDGALIIVASNQSACAIGLTDIEEVTECNAKMNSLLLSEIGYKVIYSIVTCAHDVGSNCKCRKPGPLLGEWAKSIASHQKFSIGDFTRKNTFVIGNDAFRDGGLAYNIDATYIHVSDALDLCDASFLIRRYRMLEEISCQN